ncbi:hypothetical protein ISN44_As07g007310 [Arabidopsis suecica]|uniref:Uncharacterized protein n=1 Tax=Arabidopsis suecica TaxID=45249 RepID=A0A8T2BQX1_ARASU|nr:hypothetical protein ISN44_As07g007310 [Arabidopsis suecica]
MARDTQFPWDPEGVCLKPPPEKSLTCGTCVTPCVAAGYGAVGSDLVAAIHAIEADGTVKRRLKRGNSY